MSELMELVEKLTKSETENAQMKEDLKAATGAIEAQRLELAKANPNLIDSLQRARVEATAIFNLVLPQVQPGTQIHQEIVTWLERHQMRGNS